MESTPLIWNRNKKRKTFIRNRRPWDAGSLRLSLRSEGESTAPYPATTVPFYLIFARGVTVGSATLNHWANFITP
ncbi:hypothetical protein L1987_07179 [Smallanthus sonchifolius]|uniref:Uncharacterized protein n=1 Tax=Smallanthus sonchifolius TaxID=185202 RepID=A0ACB9K0F3_9ASTR|nr:hypothetical protein L1987_07179 [Smallanthus sonchifolius]